MSSRLTRQLRFQWRERYLKLWTWLRRFPAAQPPASQGDEAMSQNLWLERLQQHFKRPPREP